MVAALPTGLPAAALLKLRCCCMPGLGLTACPLLLLALPSAVHAWLVGLVGAGSPSLPGVVSQALAAGCGATALSGKMLLSRTRGGLSYHNNQQPPDPNTTHTAQSAHAATHRITHVTIITAPPCIPACRSPRSCSSS